MDEKKKETAPQFTVFLKGERGISVEGSLLNPMDGGYFIVTEEQATHSFKKESLSTLIMDIPDKMDLSRFKEQEKNGYRVFTMSGTQLQFNGWNVACTEILDLIPEAVNAYLSDHDDLILIMEEEKYHYTGEVLPERVAKPEPPKGKLPANKKESK